MDLGTATYAARAIYDLLQSPQLNKMFSTFGCQSQFNHLKATVCTMRAMIKEYMSEDQELSAQVARYKQKFKDTLSDVYFSIHKFAAWAERKQKALSLREGDISKKLSKCFSSLNNSRASPNLFRVYTYSECKELKKKLDTMVAYKRDQTKLLGAAPYPSIEEEAAGNSSVNQAPPNTISEAITWDPSSDSANGHVIELDPNIEELPESSMTDELAAQSDLHVKGVFEIDEKRASQHAYQGGLPQIARLVLRYCYNATKAKIKRIWKWEFIKWLFMVLSVLIEVCQATVTQENAQGKISDPGYRKISVIISAVCLFISLVEIIHEGMVSKVVWQRRGSFSWFYYPGREGRIFGKFSMYFGVISSAVQLCINLIVLVFKRNFVHFDSLPLLLSFSYLVVTMADPGKTVVKCRIHDNCPRCKRDTSRSSPMVWDIQNCDG